MSTNAPPPELRCQRIASVPEEQIAATVNDACAPAATVRFAGCWVMVSTGAAALTVKVALLLVALPATLLAIARKVAPLSASVVVCQRVGGGGGRRRCRCRRVATGT
jgi:hypothetical protein